MPTERDAIAIVREVLGSKARAARRFARGLEHYVFDVDCGGASVVARLGRTDFSFAPAARWHERLAGVGVTVPAVLAHGTDPLPYMLLERLPGRDLGDVNHELTKDQKRSLAAAVATSQRRAETLPQLPGFGYARDYDDESLAPTWSAVIETRLGRSYARGRQTGSFDIAAVERVDEAARALRKELDRVRPAPYLEDATTKNVIVDNGKLSGIVDHDWVASGDPLMTVALTRVSLVAAGEETSYADALVHELDGDSSPLVPLYEAVFALDLLSEPGLRFNRGAPVTIDDPRRARLETLVDARLDVLR